MSFPITWYCPGRTTTTGLPQNGDLTALLQADKIDEALEIANGIPNTVDKSEALLEIVQAQIQASQINNALKAADEIPDEYYRSSALTKISNALLQAGDIDRACEVADEIPDEHYRLSARLKALALSKKTPDDLEKESKDLVEAGKFSKALKIANRIFVESSKSEALAQISKALAIKGKMGEACKVAYTIPSKVYQALALIELSKALVQADRIDDARSILDGIPGEFSHESTIQFFQSKVLEVINLKVKAESNA